MTDDRRFEQAEIPRQQNKQWKSEAYASRFRGSKAVEISLDQSLKAKLKEVIAAAYPDAPLHDVVIEHFLRRDLTKAEDRGGEDESALVWLHTIVVRFNGMETHWDKIVDGKVNRPGAVHLMIESLINSSNQLPFTHDAH